MSGGSTGVAVIGAGPYGLSIAAGLRLHGHSLRVFGRPMDAWRTQMPRGMLLKSEGFTCDLHTPAAGYRLRDFCAERGLPYQDIGLPVPLAAFSDYGLEFQRRHVPCLEPCDIVSVKTRPAGFELRTADGETFHARKVVVAVGVAHFAHRPHALADLPAPWASHSSAWADLAPLAGRRVAVVGAGASAVELATLLHEAGSAVQLLARGGSIVFHRHAGAARGPVQRLLRPRSGLGIGWRSRLCEQLPGLFHALPQAVRLRAVRRHLGPSSDWFVQERFEGRVPARLGVRVEAAERCGGGLRLRLAGDGGADVEVDHVIAATGYRVALRRLGFLDADLRARIATVADAPVLDGAFESSVPGLYFAGPAAANSFGPLQRFACGAGFAAGRIGRRLAALHGR